MPLNRKTPLVDRVFAIDLRGHGASTRSSDGNYSPGHLAADIESFILELDLYVRPVALVGVGLGAATALSLAAAAPRLVGALMLMEFSFVGPSEESIDPLAFFPMQAMACDGKACVSLPPTQECPCPQNCQRMISF
eukprot:scaffold56872_cov43-Prasinocladus_malaysianus.AAC.1